MSSCPFLTKHLTEQCTEMPLGNLIHYYAKLVGAIVSSPGCKPRILVYVTDK